MRTGGSNAFVCAASLPTWPVTEPPCRKHSVGLPLRRPSSMTGCWRCWRATVCCRRRPCQVTSICRVASSTLPDPVRNRALAHIVRQIGAPEHVPSGRALARLGDRLAAGQAATVGGAKFSPDEGGWLVTAEPGRRPPRLRLAAGSRAVFNHVWEIESPVEATVRHLGEAGSGAGRDWAGTPGWCALPPLVRRALPVLETLDGSVIYPHLIERRPVCAVRPSAAMRFLAIAPRTGSSRQGR